MTDSPTKEELRTTPCRGCGKPLPSGIQLCQKCTNELVHSILQRDSREHAGDIFLAAIAFGLSNLALMGMTGMDMFSVQSMLFRLVILGTPCAFVVWRWYRLMHQTDPDYGQLWYVYWRTQAIVWIVFLIVCVALGIILFLTLFMLHVPAS